MKDALLRVIDAALTAKKLDEKMVEMGYGKTPYADIYGKLEEALFIISGEDPDRFEGSTTQAVLSGDILCLERRAAILDYVRKAHNCPNFVPAQPRPNIMDPPENALLFRENGGYMAPEDDQK